MSQVLIDKNEKVRVRMAPSPTGALHIGTARTTIFNYLFARHYGGKFILRIEDTDKKRSKKKWLRNILENLLWLGIEWDEGPMVKSKIKNPSFAQGYGRAKQKLKINESNVTMGGGEYGPYFQSKRTKTYKKYVVKLLEEEKAFYCCHTQEELKKEHEQQMQNKEAPRHICSYRDKKGKKNGIIRFKNTYSGKLDIYDFVKGNIEFNAELLGDFSIARDLNSVLYNFAVVIDDYEMKISHIIRGEDHLPNTPKQVLLCKALNIPIPKFIHIPLNLDINRSKLSKREGSISLDEYIKDGYLKEAIFNFLVLLGWGPKNDTKEILTKKEIIQEFSIEGIQQSPAVFDIEKLKWMNGEYIRKKDINELTQLILPYLKKAGFGKKLKDENWIQKVILLEKNRIKILSEIESATKFILKAEKYKPKILVWKKSNKKETKKILYKLIDILENIKETQWQKETLEKIIMPKAEAIGDRGKMLWPLRVALSGKQVSPGPFEILDVLGKKESLKRVKKANNAL